LAGGGYQANPPSPLLRRCEVFASDQDEAVVVAKPSVETLTSLRLIIDGLDALFGVIRTIGI
jgi:hypothetical protein